MRSGDIGISGNHKGRIPVKQHIAFLKQQKHIALINIKGWLSEYNK